MATALLLGALQLQWIPWWRYAWGFNLWGYLPSLAAGALGLAVASVCHPAARRAIASLATRITRRAAALSTRRAELLLFVTTVVGLFLVRERHLVGDSKLMLLETGYHGRWFVIPEMGSTFLMWASLRIARFGLALSAPDGYRLVVCLAGGIFLVFLLRLARELVPRGRAPALVALLVSGGLLRVFAGHIETYGPLLAALSVYLWLAVGYLEGRRSWLAPSLALGVAIWLHGVTLLLVPSLVVLPVLRGASLERALATASRSVAVAALPTFAFVAATMGLGRSEELQEAWTMGLNVLELRSDPERVRMWVRFWGSGPSVGTDVVFLSHAHLKYLVNAAWILSPFAVPALAFAALGRRSPPLFDNPAAAVLGIALLLLVPYSVLLRPFWGPFDWDLFAVTAFFASLLAGSWLARSLDDEAWLHAAVWLIGFQLLFVGLPFLLLGVIEPRDAGPFTPGSFAFELLETGRPPPAHLAPWL